MKVYVGSAIDLRKRAREHFRLLSQGKHINPHLQAAYNKYGAEAFVFSVIEYCEPEQLLAVEQQYLDATIGVRPVYNICPMAGSSLGRPHGPEARAKISKAHKGRVSPLRGVKLSEETKRKLSEAKRGKKRRPQTPETIEKRCKKLRGQKRTPEVRALLAAQKAKTHDVRLISPTGEVFGPITNLKEFARLNDLRRTNLHQVISGARLTHRGWRVM